MPLALITDQPVVLEQHHIPAITATGEPVAFYDKDARLVPCDIDPEWPDTDKGNIWVRGEVQEGTAYGIQMNDMLHNGRVLAMAEAKGLVFQKKDDGNIIFFSVMPSGQPLSQVSSVEDLRQLLKSAFSGWHHAYHEVFAMAKSFTYFLARNVSRQFDYCT